MSLADLRTQLNNATAMAADAARRLVGVLDMKLAGQILHEQQAAEVVAANLSALIDNEAQAEERTRVIDARGRRIAAIERSAVEQTKNAQGLVSGALGKRLVAAIEELRAAQAEIVAAGHPLALTLPAPEYIEQLPGDLVATGRRLTAEAKALSAEFLDDDLAVEALGQARQAYGWAVGDRPDTPPHVVRQVVRQSIEPGSISDEAFVSEVWIADADAKDRVLWLLGEGSSL
jgi:hypothetical protein